MSYLKFSENIKYFHQNFKFCWSLFVKAKVYCIIILFSSFSHFAITHKPWVWTLVGSTHDFFNGASMYTWMHQHTLGHHPYTNIDGADPDIRTSDRVSMHYSTLDGNIYNNCALQDVRRIKWRQKWLPRYFYQHIYVPMLYCVVS